MTDNCVKLGDVVAALCSWECGVIGVNCVAIAGAADGGGGCGATVDKGIVIAGAVAVVGVATVGEAAGAATTAYLNGNAGAGSRGADCCCRPAFSTLAIGCAAKLMFGGGFATQE